MNLRSLMDWGIVFKELVPGERKEYFVAEKDIMKVARQISRERRKRELEPVLGILSEIATINPGTSKEGIELKKVAGNIHEVALRVDDVLDKFSRSDENWFYKMVLQLMK